MSITLDLNADIGEQESVQGAAAERDILRYVTSCNIACGGHAGGADTMRDRVRAAIKNNVTIGAHPSYPDRENFGRISMALGVDIDAKTLTQSLRDQISLLRNIAHEEGARIAYVKPHGSLYLDAAKDITLARLITDCMKSVNPDLALLGPPSSALETAALDKGIKFFGEGFIDRSYGADGQIVPRSGDEAVIANTDARIEQMLSLALEKYATIQDGTRVTVNAASLCLHGDSAGAVATAKAARETLTSSGIILKAFAP